MSAEPSETAVKIHTCRWLNISITKQTNQQNPAGKDWKERATREQQESKNSKRGEPKGKGREKPADKRKQKKKRGGNERRSQERREEEGGKEGEKHGERERAGEGGRGGGGGSSLHRSVRTQGGGEGEGKHSAPRASRRRDSVGIKTTNYAFKAGACQGLIGLKKSGLELWGLAGPPCLSTAVVE